MCDNLCDNYNVSTKHNFMVNVLVKYVGRIVNFTYIVIAVFLSKVSNAKVIINTRL